MLGGLDYHSLAAAVKRALGAGLGYTSKGQRIVATGQGTATVRSVGSNGQIEVADSTQSDGLIWTDFSKDPLNVNPNWNIDQIYEGATATTTATAGGVFTQIADGWTVFAVNPSGAGNGAVRTSVVTDPDFASRKALKIECTTADSTISAGDRYDLISTVEGYDLAMLGAGTSSAGSITIQFQFKTNVTGTYCVSVRNSAANRSYVGTITVSDTNVHDYAVTLTLDTSGTWLYTNGVGAYIGLSLAVGSTYQTTAGAWAAGNFLASSAQCNFMSANTNVAYLGRFHVIPGNVVCAYKPADIQSELAKCQRYYWKTYSQGVAVGTASILGARFNGSFTAGGSVQIAIPYPVAMRAAPTMVGWSYNSGTQGNWVDGAGVDQAVTFDNIGASGARGYISAGTLSQTGGHCAATARLS